MRRLIVFADRGTTGEKAADKARRLYHGSGVKVDIQRPFEGFKDFNEQHQAMVSA